MNESWMWVGERLVNVIVLLTLGVEGRKCHFYSDTPMFFFPGVIL
jgi:hypothetical protein